MNVHGGDYIIFSIPPQPTLFVAETSATYMVVRSLNLRTVYAIPLTEISYL